jgi:hypothetical protein
LTALELELRSNDDVAALMQQLTSENAVAALRSVLPTQLRSFSLAVRATVVLDAPTQLLFPSIFSAVAVMLQLTELDIRFQSHGIPLGARFDALTQLPQLRKLAMYGIEWTDERLAEFKQLSQLRELNSNLMFDQLIALCQPPHSMQQLECIDLGSISVDKSVMRALLHLPTLTDLAPACFHSEAWAMLPQLPLLRRLTVNPFSALSDVCATLLATSLSGCRALTELSLGGIVFEDVDRADPRNEQQQACWAEILRSVPLVQRFAVDTRQALSLLAVLPEHLPQLVHLELCTSAAVIEVVARLAHPTVQEFELVRPSSSRLDALQLRELVGSPRVPCLVRCTCSVS